MNFNTDLEKANYLIGHQIGRDLAGQGIPLQSDALLQGILESFEGKDPSLSADEANRAMQSLQQLVHETATQKAREAAASGVAFLEQNKSKLGVVTLPSGLQYKVIRDGSGAKPSATSTVVTHYRGTLIDGTEFDSSYARGEPASFPVNRVIRGWTEALQLMSVGSKWELYVPSELAYGERGAPPKIAPHSVLIFEVELLEIKS